jgi:hypothetical protein
MTGAGTKVRSLSALTVASHSAAGAVCGFIRILSRGADTRWLLELIVVRSKLSGNAWEFRCNEWIPQAQGAIGAVAA